MSPLDEPKSVIANVDSQNEDPMITSDKNPPPASSRPHVLVVDGRSIDILIIGHYLRQLDCRHDVVTTCEEALARVKQTRYDVALIDAVTLGLDKEGLLDCIRQREKETGGRPTKIVGMSTASFPVDLRNGNGSGVNGYLTKPCNPRSLAQALGFQDWGSRIPL